MSEDPAPLRLWGREFDGFRRAVDAHARAWAGGPVEARWSGLAELQAGVLGERAPDADVLLVPADWLPALAARGRIAPLTAYLEGAAPEGWPTAWSPSFHAGVTWDLDIYGLPFHDGPQLLFTRPSLLAEHGLSAPRTWSELLAVARVLHVPDGRGGTVLAGAPDGHNNVYDFVLHLRRAGADLVDADGRVVVDTSAVRGTLAFLRSLATDLVPADARDLDSNGSGGAFADGRVGVSVNWAGYAALARAGVVGDDVACQVAPALEDGTPTPTVNAFWVACVTTACPDPDRAWDYLRHASSAAMDRETSLAGASGARRSTWADPALLASCPEQALFEQAHQHSRPLPRLAELPEIVDVLSELVDAVVWRGEELETAVAAADQAIAGVVRR